MKKVTCAVTVVIPNYNGMAYLKDCLDSLEKQSCQDFHTILIDNGSADESIAFVQEYYSWAEVVPLDKNYGFCYAVNTGIHRAETPYVFLLNNDTILDKGCLEALLHTMEQHPNCFSCASRMIKMQERELLDDGGDYYSALGWAYALGKDKPWKYYMKERKIFASCAGAALYRRKVFDEIGVFDEKHFAYLEDIDVGYRARIFGYENCYVPGAAVLHVGSGTTGSRYNEFKVRYSARNNLYLIYKNMPVLQIVLNSPLLLVGFLIKGAFFQKKGLGAEYRKGLSEGVHICKRENKVHFDGKHIGNYCRIQLELWVNIFRRFLTPAKGDNN